MNEEMNVEQATPQAENYDPVWDEGYPQSETVETEEVTEVESEEVTEEPTETNEEVEEAEEDTTEAEEPAYSWQDLKLKYLKDERTLGEFEPEEAQAIFQKGMDYDRQVAKLEPFKEISELYGIPLDKIHETLIDDYLKSQADKNNSTFEFEKEKYNFNREKMIAEREKKEAQRKSDEAESAKSAQQKMLKQFLKAYPDVKETEIPDSVWARVKEGSSLLDAYEAHTNSDKVKNLEAEVAKLTKQLENKKTSPVKPTSKNGAKAKASDTLFGGVDWDK